MPIPSNKKAVLIDMAGVLYIGDRAIPGAASALQRLRRSNYVLRFLTNTTRSARTTIVRQMREMGFDVHDDEVFTAPQAARALIERRGLRPFYLVHPNIEAEMGPSASDPNVVVLGDAGELFTYARLNQVFRYLMNGLPLIAMAKNRYFKEPDGLSLDMGAFVAGLEFSADVIAEIVGKPAAAYFETALTQLGVSADEAVMIGDDLVDDIVGAQNAGIEGILVRTGKFRSGDDRHPEHEAAHVYDDFAAAIDALLL